ncbi:MAG: hypothetical protein ACR2HH_03205 [Chthoniobacterales bacterium]
MRTLPGLILIAATLVASTSCRKSEDAATPSANSSTAQPAPSRQPYQHDWAKSALDRAAEVKRQVAEKRRQDETN